jgi:voltage-gated potassium channel
MVAMSNVKRVLLLFSVLAVFITIDVTGYILIEEVSFSDALFMTVISITTVGYGEVFPLTPQGRLFTIWVIVSGLASLSFIVTKVAENVFEGNIRRILGRRKMRMISKMKDHVIVAGFGRMGEHVCREMSKRKIKFLVMESDGERFAMAEELEYNVLLGDATNEESLDKAGIDRARTFISLLSSDADNIFTVIAVREINPGISIISRALDTANEKRLYKVGANRVISPYELGSRRIVNTVLRPNVVEFFDVMTYAPNMSLSLEELTVHETSPLAGKKIKDSGLRQDYNIIVIGVKRGEEMFYNPSSDQELKAGDILILVGEKEKLLSLN